MTEMTENEREREKERKEKWTKKCSNENCPRCSYKLNKY